MPRRRGQRRHLAAASAAARDAPRVGGLPGKYRGVADTSPLVAVARTGAVRPPVAKVPFTLDDDIARPLKRRKASSTSRATPPNVIDPCIAELERRWKAVVELTVRMRHATPHCTATRHTHAPYTFPPLRLAHQRRRERVVTVP